MVMNAAKINYLDILCSITGPQHQNLIKSLLEKGKQSEFDLAEIISSDIKEVRKILYKLHNHDVVSFTRKKDREKGWYIYFWEVEVPKIKNYLLRIKKKELDYLSQSLVYEESHLFFINPEYNVRLTFDEATEYDFRCPESGELLTQEDNVSKIMQIKERINDLREEINLL